MKIFSQKNCKKHGAHGLRAFCTFSILLLLFFTNDLKAGKVYQKSSDFVAEQFGGSTPKATLIKLTAEMQSRIERLNGRKYGYSSVRYWKKGEKQVFVLNDIGKTKPITAGYVVESGKMTLVKVLTYRESHGNEVKNRYFTKQFRKMTLKKNGRLSKRPSNIAGATLSVNSLTRMARVALYLDSKK